ncbi:TlpA family protein disulfide reductase [Winogradskyella psychrotolerans]|uniref:TlpA family protein disulfide reductase n=1 Tax=Winogradskyella psychrotolerans TaxID=1344585 RepID=UPI001C07ABC7|nr:TlpA disulfide reductase family protein [Winogradskyella psychrotolerans]MBU2920475.1 TlpA family protein disulfide reductase [Winogradskyella psychrotolerans]
MSCNNTNTDKTLKSNTTTNHNQDIPVYDFNQFEPLIYTDSNKTYLINFWAMWCAPCVKELPYIEQFAVKHPDVEVILVSLDFPKDIETKLKPFLKEKNISSKVVLLDDPDSNTWINKIAPNWSGAIPFTIMFNKDERLFYERSFENLEDLENQINKLN